MGISRYKVLLINRGNGSVVESAPIYRKFFILAVWELIKAWYNYQKTHTNFYNSYTIEYERIG